MKTRHRLHLAGVQRLYNETKNTPTHEKVTALQHRLNEVYEDIDIHGPSESNSAAGTIIIVSLNDITEKWCGKNFDDYCQEHENQQHLATPPRETKEKSPRQEKATIISAVPKKKPKKRAKRNTLNNASSTRAYDFLRSADTYITTLLPHIKHAKQMFGDIQLSLQEYINICNLIQPFSYEYIPYIDTTLLRIHAELSFLSDKIASFTKLFQTFCDEMENYGTPRAKTTRESVAQISDMLAKAESIKQLITPITKEIHPPTKP